MKQKFQEVNENVKAVQEYDENVRASIALSQRVNHSQLVESKVQLSEALIKLDVNQLSERWELSDSFCRNIGNCMRSTKRNLKSWIATTFDCLSKGIIPSK